MLIECSNPEEVVKEAFFLAYQNAGREMGMGVFQAKSGTTKDDVWNNVTTGAEYGGNVFKDRANKPGQAYGDYIFGRMCKLSLKWTETGVDVQESQPRTDYQAWCRVFPSYEALVRKAIENLSKS